MAASVAQVSEKVRESSYRTYDLQSRQPCIRLAVEVRLGALRDTSRIDSWLAGPFAVPERRLETSTSQPQNNTHDTLARAVAERALVLFAELCRAGGMPCFETGRVLSLRALAHRPQDREVTVLLPIMDHVPIGVFRSLMRNIVKLLTTSLAKEPAAPLVQSVLSEVKQTIVDRLQDALKLNSSTMPICRLAFDHDIPFRHVGNGFFLLGTGAKATIMRGSAVVRDSALGAQICIYKQVTADILRAAGFPAAKHRSVESRQGAVAAARELGWPVVVKPSNLERSEGVTVNITSETELVAAYDLAAGKGGQTLVERQIPGYCHRIMVADGRLVYAVVRYGKGVIGNGRDTVAELAKAANARWAAMPPWKRLKDVPLDDEALKCLAGQGLTLDSIPAADQRALVRPINSDEWGGDIEPLNETIHPDNVKLAVDVASLLGLTIAGIDLMSVDITRPWHENGAAIIEVNFDPQVAITHRGEVASNLLPAIVDGDGSIPVHLVVGEGDLLAHARKLRSEWAGAGHISSASHTEDAAGAEIVMEADTLFERTIGLVMRRDVHELILVGHETELSGEGLAVDRLASVHVLLDDPQNRDRLEAELLARFRVTPSSSRQQGSTAKFSVI